MVMMMFTVPEHVMLLLSHKKTQTTRLNRADLKPGDILHCYYKPRAKKSCSNCICLACLVNPTWGGVVEYDLTQARPILKYYYCGSWNNYFGEALVTSIYSIKSLPPKLLNNWAISDGFKDFCLAHNWFKERYGLDWKEKEMRAIVFDPRWGKIDFR